MTTGVGHNSVPTWATPRLTDTPDGEDVIDFARTFLHVDKGMRAGDPLELVQWQRDLIHSLYERRPDGLAATGVRSSV